MLLKPIPRYRSRSSIRWLSNVDSSLIPKVCQTPNISAVRQRVKNCNKVISNDFDQRGRSKRTGACRRGCLQGHPGRGRRPGKFPAGHRLMGKSMRIPCWLCTKQTQCRCKHRVYHTPEMAADSPEHFPKCRAPLECLSPCLSQIGSL